MVKKHLLRYSLVGTCLALLLMGSFGLLSGRASADSEATWIDDHTIVVNGVNYVRCDKAGTGCQSSGCDKTGKNCALKTNLYVPTGFKLANNSFDCGQPNAIAQNLGKSVVDTNSNTLITVTAIKDVPNTSGQKGPATVRVCTTSEKLNFTNSSSNPTQGTGATAGSGAKCADGSDKDADGKCKNDANTGILDCGGGFSNWFTCPLIRLLSNSAQAVDNLVTNTLDIDVKYIFDGVDKAGTQQAGYYAAWNSFRVIGTAILVIAGLVMIASQALGFEFLDAYTIRKVLPRMVVAIIGMSLSWPLMRLTVNFFDILGFDIRSIIFWPFRDFKSSISTSGGILTTLGGAAAIMLMGWTSLTLIFSALLAVLMGYLVLVLREVAIILLIILAPLAIACYVLPNTSRVWNLWRENFIGLLMAFPIIAGLISMGRVFGMVAISQPASIGAHLSGLTTGLFGHLGLGDHHFVQSVAATANNIGSVAAEASAIVASYGPYLLMGKAVTWGTGAASTLIGGVGNVAGGLQKKWANDRRETASGNFKRMQNQTYFRKTNPVGRGLNSALSWATDPINNAAYHTRNLPGIGGRGAQIESHLEHQRIEQTKKAVEAMNLGNNDKAYRATNGALHDGFSAETKKRLADKGLLGKNIGSLKDYNTMADVLSQSSDQSERLAANALHGFRGTAANMFKDPESARASLAGASMIGLASHGFLNPHDLAPATNMVTGGAATAKYTEVTAADGTKEYKLTGVSGGSKDGAAFAQTIATQAQVIASRSRPDIGAGYALDYKGGEFVNALAQTHTETNAAGETVQVVRNDSLRALENTTRLGSGAIGGSKAGLYKTGDQGIGDAVKYILDNGDTDKARAAVEEVATWDADTKTKAKNDQSSAGYEKLKLAHAASRYNEFAKTVTQIAGPYSQADTENRTDLVKLVANSNSAHLLDDVRRQRVDPQDPNAQAILEQQRAAAEAAEEANKQVPGQGTLPGF
jgi:hypothetical protein